MKTRTLSLFLSAVVLLSSCQEDDDMNMTDSMVTEEESVRIINSLFDFTEAKSTEVYDLLSTDIIVSFKMNPNGSIQDEDLVGLEAIRGQITFLFDNFSEINYLDRRITPANNGRTVFAQCIISNVLEGSASSFENVLIYRFDLDETGVIDKWEEYLNPVTNGEIFGIPLGSCQEILCN